MTFKKWPEMVCTNFQFKIITNITLHNKKLYRIGKKGKEIILTNKGIAKLLSGKTYSCHRKIISNTLYHH